MSDNIITFGCRLNSYESEIIRDAMSNAGITDVLVFNTCAVTKEAERQARQAIRKARKDFPEKQIIVTGCAAQINPKIFSEMKEVDKVIGNEEKLRPESYAINPLFTTNDAKIAVNDIMSITETASHLISGFEGKARAFVQVQNGCNHRCTFCIIPYGRGNSRSVPMGEIVTQVRKLVEAGYNEVVLTGVDISDYGKDLPGQPSLGQMMRRLLALVPELPRLRLSSIDVAEIDHDIMRLIAEEPRLMPHIHISLQAGDNMILKRMKRRHSREDVINFCRITRDLRPDIAFGADIIAGFPTETDEMFTNSLNLISEAALPFLHIFPYSEREGTPAARMPQVPVALRKERAAQLRMAGDLQLEQFMSKHVGQTARVIMEKEDFGRSEHFTTVQFNRPASIPAQPVGSIVTATITGIDGKNLVGEAA
jgi:threonylcarbamoyladenosine tRNA methylthiotransferase MtaB